jgi:hypothetical protein
MGLKYRNRQIDFVNAIAPMVVLALILAVGFVSVAQVYQVTGPNGAGGTITINVTAPATQPSSSSQPSSPPSSQPTNPVGVNGPPTTGPTTLPAGNEPSIPGVSGMTYETDRWRGTFTYDANGFPDPPAPPSNAVWLSSPSCGWAQAGDYSDLNLAKYAAYNSGSYYIRVRRGSTFTNNQVAGTPGTLNTGTDIPGGTQAHPVVIEAEGPNGYRDYSKPAPVMLGQISVGGKDFAPASTTGQMPAMNYYEFFGLDFYADKRDPASPTYNATLAGNGTYQQSAIYFVDNGFGQSDHFLISACRFRSFMSPVAFQVASVPSGYTLNDVWIDHCTFQNCYGSRFFGYFEGVHDRLMDFCTEVRSGWDPKVFPKDGSGMEHCIYDNNNEVTATSGYANEPSDPEMREFNCILAQAESMGDKAALGGLHDTELYLACPIALFGIHWPTYVNNCVVDGDPQEFDPITSTSNNGAAVTGITGGALADGYPGTIGSETGQGRGYGVSLVTQPNASITSTLFIDKNDVINDGPAIQVATIDNNNPGNDPPVSGTITVTDCIVHDWAQGQMNVTVSGPNTVLVSNTNGQTGTSEISTAAPTITYSNDVLPGMAGVTGVSAVEPNYFDDTRTTSTYAKGLGVAGVVDGPSFLIYAAANNWQSSTFDSRFTAGATNSWIWAGFQHQ